MNVEATGTVWNKCKVFKSDYHKDANKKDGLCTVCADCKRRNAIAWLRDNPERSKNNALTYYYSHKDDPPFKEKRKANEKRWREENPDKKSAKEAKRRAKKLKATPPWLSDEHYAHIKRTYRLCSVISAATKQKYHVDHIVPLQGKNVCGLHVPWNLVVIPAKLNLEKGNRHD